MKRKALALVFMFCLGFSTFTIMEFASLSHADPYIPPEEAPPGYRIYSDGTFDVENLRRDGDVYTLTGDVQGTIVIERDGVVIDGAGYTLSGNGSSYGIWLQDRINVTIKRLEIRNFWLGIRFSHYVANRFSTNPNRATNCTIKACSITNCSSGMWLSFCLNCKLLGNYIASNSYGLRFTGSGNTFRNNSIEENQYNFCGDVYNDNDVDASNTVDGKPIYYWINQHNMTVPENAGIVILRQCSGIKIQNLNLTRNMHGISLANTNDTTIYGNQISSNQYGITLYYSHNATIIGNQITNNTGYAIDQYDSNSNIISNNLIEFNKDAIYAGDTLNTVISSNQIISNQGAAIIGGFNNCTITKNYVFENTKAISVGNNCLITENNITKNSDIGITFRNHNVIMANYICENSGGLSTMEGTNNTIVSNAIVQNAGWGISFTGRFIYTNMRVPQNNLIYHNNFIGNNNGGTQIFISDITFLENGTMKKSEGLANFWDNGVEGNYWSDYHPTTQENENSTLGNTPYYINENNQDNYPLLAPLEFAALELPALEPPQETEQTATDPATLPALVIACIALVTTASIGLLFYFKKRKT